MEQGKDKKNFKDIDHHVSLSYTIDKSFVHACGHCNKLVAFGEDRGDEKCPDCGETMYRIDEDDIILLVIGGLKEIISGYLPAFSKHWKGYIIGWLRRDIKMFLKGLMNYNTRKIKVKVRIPRGKWLTWIKKELRSMIKRDYEWSVIRIMVDMKHFIILYEFIKMDEGWMCNVRVGE